MRAVDLIGALPDAAVPMVCIVAGVLCFSSSRDSGGRLLAFFAVAFWLLGLNWTVLAIVYGWGRP